MKIATWNLWNKNPDQFASVEFLIGLGAEVICLQEVLLETVFQIQKFCQSEKDKNLAKNHSIKFSNEENSKEILKNNLEKNNENQVKSAEFFGKIEKLGTVKFEIIKSERLSM